MDFQIYCDESRQENFHRRDDPNIYVLIGGVWLPADLRRALKGKIRDLRDRHNLHGEFKWNKVSPSRLGFYTDLVDLFFAEDIRFRCIVLQVSELDAVQFHQADNELMFYKFYYQLIHHWILDRNRYRIFVDLKTSRVHNRLQVLHRCLQNSNLTSDVVSVQALPSDELDILQLADVLIGAVGYRFHREHGSRAKKAVCERVEKHIGHGIGPTTKGYEKFNVFRFRPQGGW